MDEAGNISKNPNAIKFDQVPDGRGGYKSVLVPPRKTPAAAPSAAATAGHPDTIKTGTQQFGSTPVQGPDITKPLVPPVLASPAVPLPPALGASPTSVFHSNAGSPGASAQPFGSLGASGQKPPLGLLGGARARGGPVQAGRPYLVGEEGPEIVVPGQSGTVVPNHALEFSRPQEQGAGASGRWADSAEETGSDEAGHEGDDRASHAPNAFASDAAATPTPARQTTGLFMSPRPMPAAYAQERMSGGRGGFSGYARSDAPGTSYASTLLATSARDEADGQRGDSWDNRPPPTQPDAPATPAKTTGRLFEKRSTPEAYFTRHGLGAMQLQRGRGPSPSSPQQGMQRFQAAAPAVWWWEHHASCPSSTNTRPAPCPADLC